MSEEWGKFFREKFTFVVFIIACLVSLLNGHNDAALIFGVLAFMAS